jgi:hypothetical protein
MFTRIVIINVSLLTLFTHSTAMDHAQILLPLVTIPVFGATKGITIAEVYRNAECYFKEDKYKERQLLPPLVQKHLHTEYPFLNNIHIFQTQQDEIMCGGRFWNRNIIDIRHSWVEQMQEDLEIVQALRQSTNEWQCAQSRLKRMGWLLRHEYGHIRNHDQFKKMLIVPFMGIAAAGAAHTINCVTDALLGDKTRTPVGLAVQFGGRICTALVEYKILKKLDQLYNFKIERAADAYANAHATDEELEAVTIFWKEYANLYEKELHLLSEITHPHPRERLQAVADAIAQRHKNKNGVIARNIGFSGTSIVENYLRKLKDNAQGHGTQVQEA